MSPNATTSASAAGTIPMDYTGVTPPSSSNSSLNQADFLNLLVAQMSAQDPLQPVSNTDFLAQMAQFSTLQQTQTMEANLAGIQSGQMILQANSLLGRQVQVQTGDNLTDTGLVTTVGMQAGTPTIVVNGRTYDLSQVLSVSTPPTQPN